MTESSSSRLKRTVSMLQVEWKQLQACMTQLNSALEFLNKTDSSSVVVNRDNSVLKYNLVMKEYEPVEKSKRKFMIKYLYRIKLICRWRRLYKKRQERLKERKMNILQLIDGEEKYIRGLLEYITNIKEPIERLNALN